MHKIIFTDIDLKWLGRTDLSKYMLQNLRPKSQLASSSMLGPLLSPVCHSSWLGPVEACYSANVQTKHLHFYSPILLLSNTNSKSITYPSWLYKDIRDLEKWRYRSSRMCEFSSPSLSPPLLQCQGPFLALLYSLLTCFSWATLFISFVFATFIYNSIGLTLVNLCIMFKLVLIT